MATSMSDLYFEILQFELLQIKAHLSALDSLSVRLTSIETRLTGIESRLLMVNIINAAQGAQISQAGAGQNIGQESG